jgi:hypothetical protein
MREPPPHLDLNYNDPPAVSSERYGRDEVGPAPIGIGMREFAEFMKS